MDVEGCISCYHIVNLGPTLYRTSIHIVVLGVVTVRVAWIFLLRNCIRNRGKQKKLMHYD